MNGMSVKCEELASAMNIGITKKPIFFVFNFQNTYNK